MAVAGAASAWYGVSGVVTWWLGWPWIWPLTVRTILPRLAESGDLSRDVLDYVQRLPPLS
jgi:hypothetical protein